MRSRNEANRAAGQAPQRWSMADDYLADPAVAPLRALVAAVARRISARREGRPGDPPSRSQRRNAGSIPSPGALLTS